jgi:dipeptidyl aminopeptidase/acylaminoacyl peptidase
LEENGLAASTDARSLVRALIVSVVLLTMLAVAPTALAEGRIALTSAVSGNEDIWVVDPLGANPVDLTWLEPGSDQSPAWSPDGTRIAFVSDRSGIRHVWLMNADGSNPQQLTGDAGLGGSDADPAWSPDGTQVAFASTRNTGSWAIWVVGIDGSGLHRLSPGFGTSPAWSPDGSRLAFDSFGAIHVMNADGSGDHALTSGDTPDSAPAWSPDGAWIAFARYRSDWQTSNVREIWTVRSDGTQPSQLTGLGGYSDHPSWSPEGARVVFQVRPATGPSTSSSLVTILLNSRALSPVGNAPPGSLQPAWGPSRPSIELRIPRDGQEFAQNSFVYSHYFCDSTSVTCVGTVPANTQLDTSRPGEFIFTVVATDAAGRTTTVTATYRVRDLSAPSVVFRTPCCDEPTYLIGTTVATSFSCDDGPFGSGVELCSGDPYLDTSTIGNHSFTVETRDGAGNTGTSQQPYRVIWPFALAPSTLEPPTYNVFRAGDRVAVRFTLGGDRGPDVLEDIYYIGVDCETGSGYGTGGVLGTLSYNGSNGQYTYKWETNSSLAGSCARLTFQLRDNTWHETWIRFKR